MRLYRKPDKVYARLSCSESMAREDDYYGDLNNIEMRQLKPSTDASSIQSTGVVDISSSEWEGIIRITT